MGDSRKMEHTVGGAAQSHVHSHSIHKGFFCHNIPWADISAVHLHDLHASVLCQLDAFGVNGRDGSVSLKSHSQNLC